MKYGVFCDENNGKCGRTCCKESFFHDYSVLLDPEMDPEPYDKEIVLETGQRVIPFEDGVCAYFEDGQCLVRDRMPFGCRIFDCRKFYDFDPSHEFFEQNGHVAELIRESASEGK